jgi:hypothetical protein
MISIYVGYHHIVGSYEVYSLSSTSHDNIQHPLIPSLISELALTLRFGIIKQHNALSMVFKQWMSAISFITLASAAQITYKVDGDCTGVSTRSHYMRVRKTLSKCSSESTDSEPLKHLRVMMRK